MGEICGDGRETWGRGGIWGHLRVAARRRRLEDLVRKLLQLLVRVKVRVRARASARVRVRVRVATEFG